MKAEREITNEYNRKESEDFEEKVRDEAGRSGGKDGVFILKIYDIYFKIKRHM